MKKKILITASAAAAVALLAIFCTALRWYTDNRRENFTSDVELYVRPGMSPDEILAQMPDSAVVRKGSLERVMRGLEASAIKPGHYVVPSGKPSVYLPRTLRNGWQTPVKLVLSGTMRKKETIARKIAVQMMLDSTQAIAALNDSVLLSHYGFTPRDVFSLMIPDTYEVYWTDSMEDILGRMKKEWDSFWTEDNVRKAKAQGLTPKEVSILASIVKAESNHVPEYPSIAGVYLNRLHRGMPLQADPTVAFCFDYSLNRVLFKHLEVDSPYNTYLHAGLPPGPICVPDKACLKAVLNPDGRAWLFFCASPAMDGTHRFAATLAEHSANARAFQRELDVRRAAKSSETR